MRRTDGDPVSDETDDVRDELRAVAASLRAYLEWQADSGATGIPRGERGLRVAPRPPAPAPVDAVAVAAHGSAPTAQAPAAQGATSLTAMAPVAEVHAPPAATADTSAFALEVPRPPARVAPLPRPAPAEAPAPTAPTEIRSLPVLAKVVSECHACVLGDTRNNTVFSRGNPEAAIVFVGEGPGADEDASGLPFVGRAGQLLDKMIAAMGLDPERDVYVCNIVKCRPPGNRRPEPEEMTACFPYLDEQLANVKPKVMVALGGTAATALFDTKLGITRLRGQWKLYKGIPTMPTFHPSYLLRPSDQQAEAKRQCWEDLQAVMKELGLTRKPKA